MEFKEDLVNTNDIPLLKWYLPKTNRELDEVKSNCSVDLNEENTVKVKDDDVTELLPNNAVGSLQNNTVVYNLRERIKPDKFESLPLVCVKKQRGRKKKIPSSESFPNRRKPSGHLTEHDACNDLDTLEKRIIRRFRALMIESEISLNRIKRSISKWVDGSCSPLQRSEAMSLLENVKSIGVTLKNYRSRVNMEKLTRKESKPILKYIDELETTGNDLDKTLAEIILECDIRSQKYQAETNTLDQYSSTNQNTKKPVAIRAKKLLFSHNNLQYSDLTLIPTSTSCKPADHTDTGNVRLQKRKKLPQKILIIRPNTSSLMNQSVTDYYPPQKKIMLKTFGLLSNEEHLTRVDKSLKFSKKTVKSTKNQEFINKFDDLSLKENLKFVHCSSAMNPVPTDLLENQPLDLVIKGSNKENLCITEETLKGADNISQNTHTNTVAEENPPVPKQTLQVESKIAKPKCYRKATGGKCFVKRQPVSKQSQIKLNNQSIGSINQNRYEIITDRLVDSVDLTKIPVKNPSKTILLENNDNGMDEDFPQEIHEIENHKLLKKTNEQNLSLSNIVTDSIKENISLAASHTVLNEISGENTANEIVPSTIEQKSNFNLELLDWNNYYVNPCEKENLNPTNNITTSNDRIAFSDIACSSAIRPDHIVSERIQSNVSHEAVAEILNAIRSVKLKTERDFVAIEELDDLIGGDEFTW